MGRTRREAHRARRARAERRWPLLSNLIACHFNQDFDIVYGSLEGAIAAAAGDGSIDHRRAVLKEWRDWNAVAEGVEDIRPLLDESFAIDIGFRTPADARALMTLIHDGLLAGVKAETERRRDG